MNFSLSSMALKFSNISTLTPWSTKIESQLQSPLSPLSCMIHPIAKPSILSHGLALFFWHPLICEFHWVVASSERHQPITAALWSQSLLTQISSELRQLKSVQLDLIDDLYLFHSMKNLRLFLTAKMNGFSLVWSFDCRLYKHMSLHQIL